jgi:hypothetical protein
MRALGVVAVLAACGRFDFDPQAPPAADAPDAADAAADAVMAGYNDVTLAANWTVFDTTTFDANAKGFVGGTFDGRYVYFAPYDNGGYDGLAVRYDTQAAFNAPGSWAAFDIASQNASARGYAGAVHAGQYVYFVPNYNGADQGFVARYDTQAAFTTATAWSIFDTTAADAKLLGYQGGTFDGRYLYFVPWNDAVSDGNIARYDTQAAFTATTSWTRFDASAVDAMAVGLFGAVFDGRYVYFMPNDFSFTDGLAIRYDTQAAYTQLASWEKFDATTLDPNAAGYSGGGFDGRYIYYAPTYARGIALRFDTQGAFTAAASWSTFDTTTINAAAKGYFGTAFDGRYLYFIPNNNGADDGLIVRYDTLAAFTASASWATFDLTTVNAGCAGYHGAVFDGRYLYLIPAAANGLVARFDARSPSSPPPNPSFF